MALGGREERQLAERHLRRHRHGREEPQEGACQPLRRGAVEEVAVVLQSPHRPGAPERSGRQREGEVELRRPESRGQRLQGETR